MKGVRICLICILLLCSGILYGEDTPVSKTPTWIEKITFKGDFRLRAQYESMGSETPRFRERLRARIKGDTSISENVKMGLGLATGAGDPRSTNQTLGESFSTKSINLDQAFISWKASEFMSLKAGKFAHEEAIWKPSDLLWDSDITIEGFSLNTSIDIKGKTGVFLNSGAYVIDENSGADDIYMYVIQPGARIDINSSTMIKAACTAYGFDNIRNYESPYSGGGNSVDGINGGLIYRYDCISAGLELKIKETVLPLVAAFGELVVNPEPADNTGYLLGVKFGDGSVKEPGQWQVKYMFRLLEGDAWPDFLPDSDVRGGSTGINSHEVVLRYGLEKNVFVDLDYYCTTQLIDSKVESLFQLDFNFKF